LSQGDSTERILPLPLLWTSEEAAVHSVAKNSPIQSLSDEILLVALRGADRESLAELFRRHSRLVFSIGLRILRDRGEAEEVVQEVFLFLFERAELFDERKGGAKAWLVQVAYHRSLDRRDYLDRRNFYLGTNTELLADTLAGREDVERGLESKQDRERLKRAFERLSERQRLTLELFFFEGLYLREIAARLDESLENVRHHYYRGLQKLRKDTFIKSLKDKHES
jgi:RNA polymerase sigma-70 factor, ECF subfamily